MPYKIQRWSVTGYEQIIRLVDGAAIPIVSSNLDYQEAMTWLAANNLTLEDLEVELR